MKALLGILAIIGAMTLSACVTGRPYTFSPLTIRVTVIDAKTKKPIPNAALRVVAVGNHTGRKFVWDGFRTDAGGVCLVQTPSKSTWIGGSEAFSGGFSRRLEVEAESYVAQSVREEVYDPERREMSSRFSKGEYLFEL
mgnify:CR=1 FL=1